MEIFKRRLEAELPVTLPNLLVSELKGDFTPLITTVKREYWNKMGVPFNADASDFPESELAGGELYLSKGGNLFYFKIPSDRAEVECGGIMRNGDPGEFTAFFEAVKGVIQRELKGRETEWKSLTKEEAFKELSAKGATLNPTKEEAQVARELEDANLLRILMKTQNVTSFSTRDLSNFVDNPQTAEPLLERLVRTGLMTKDFVVLCKEKGQQIIKVGSRQAIEETSQKGLKCFLCGKPISEESIEELLSCTDLARKMMYNGYWLPVRIVEGLGKIGIKPREIVEESGDDAFTLYFYSSGEIALVAPFDRKFTLPDAYTLNAKLSVSQAGIGILVSTQAVSPIFKEFLVQSNPYRSLHFLDGFSGFEDKVEQILKLRRQENVRKLVEPFTELTPVVLRDLVCQKFFPEDVEAKKSPPASSAPQPPAGRKGKQARQEAEEEERAEV